MAGKRIVLTGASGGIGQAVADRLGPAGATVALLGRRLEVLDEVAGRLRHAGADARPYRVELRDAAQVDEVAQQILADLGGVDILINNAGVSIRRPVVRSLRRRRDHERLLAVNYLGPIGLTLAFLAGMIERGHGQIINVSSAGTQNHTPGFGAYNASKAALDAWAKTAAAELAVHGVRITTVYMPLVATAMTAPTNYRARRLYTSEEGAALIVRALIARPARVAARLGSLGALIEAVAPRAHQLAGGLASRRLSAIEEAFLMPQTMTRPLRRKRGPDREG